MITLLIKPSVGKLIDKLPLKHRRQVKNYILNLCNQPIPSDSKLLKGYSPYRRGDIGEYRVIYEYAEQEKLLTVVLVGKRNGDEVYKRLKRILTSR